MNTLLIWQPMLTANISNRLKKYDAFLSSGVFKDPKNGLRVNCHDLSIASCYFDVINEPLSNCGGVNFLIKSCDH